MTGSEPLSFIHRFQPATGPAATPLLLLHGTGGNEDDLLPLGRMISPPSALLSPRGQVLENGMPRFFRRLAEGVFDEADLRRRASELADFIGHARDRYAIAKPVAIGYSNGANIAAALMLLQPGVLSGAILLRAMAPFRDPPHAELAGAPVLILSGAADPIVPAKNALQLADTLRNVGALVDHRSIQAGHELSKADVATAKTWLQQHQT